MKTHQAMSYDSVYFTGIAMGTNAQQALTAFREAAAFDGPSLALANSHCITHGIEMRDGLNQQYEAVARGY